MKKSIICFLGIVLMTGSATSFASETSKEDAKPLFEQKCSKCHSIERPQSIRKTGKQWEQTVMRMKNTNGAPVSDAEAKLIIEYLSENYGT